MSSSGLLAQWLSELARQISQSDPAAVGIGVALLAAGCAYTSWRTWRNVSHIRLIEDTPTARIRSAPQGYVELEGMGKLMDGPPIIAKLSGLPCVWYRYQIEQQVKIHYKGHAQTRWEVIEKDESTETFWLQDETGRVVIDPEGADVSPRHKDRWRSSSSLGGIARRPAGVSNFFTSHSGHGSYRLTEERINNGERLYALGLLKSVSSYTSMPSVDEDVREMLKDWKKDQTELLQRFDLNKDGKIDEIEWRLARAQARRESMKNRQEQVIHSADGLSVMGPTRDGSRPYILSAFTQAELTKRYKLWAALYAGACFLLGLVAVWVFNAKFI
ncbi:MAG: E3 ubiquitin ligase family protein [Sulfuricaulis sp.]|nr:E3 ubiquitin ligase family protein [Sulfuricaulis sp.]